ncbi:MAG: hypothetical protein J1F65_03005 [Clostridiales bacterium]|nr:hypothetical protein [Clostridiales bacterium]
MPKFKILCVLLAAVIAAVGTVLVIGNLLGGEEIAPFEKPTTDPNTYLDLTEDVDITDTDTDVREFLFIAHKVLLQGKGFYGVSRGSTTAAGIKQNVLNTRYVIGEFDDKHVLKEMVTAGIVSNGYQLYLKGSNYIYRTGNVKALDNVAWATDAQPLTEESFYNDFGHRNDKLTGYILNWDTVNSGELTSVDNGLYTFRYVLDVNESPAYLRREMITNGGLKSEPSFSKCEIYVTMDANFVIQSLRTDCEYKADLGFIKADCSEDITETFEPYEGELPYTDFFKDYLGKGGGGIVKDLSALDVLMSMFAPYLNGEDLQVALSVDNNGAHFADALLSISGLDISDLGKLQVAAQLGDVNLSYLHGDGAIYLKYQDFKGSATVDGILGLVNTLMPLVSGGDGGDLGALGDVDPASLLENLTFALYDDDTKCVVNLPISLGGIDIDANLYADVDGENYTFTYATVAIGSVELTIAPQAWTVGEIVKDEYSEILGLADLIENGKLSLTANVDLTLNGSEFTVAADLLVDLATKNLSVNAQLDKYGKISATLADGVAYVTFGEIKVKLDTANIEELIGQIEKLVGGEISVNTPSLSLSDLLGALTGITATKRGDKVAFELALDGIHAAIYLASIEGRWQLDSIAVSAGGIDATVAPSDSFGEVVVPSDKDSYADVTQLIEEFSDPILNILNANGFGAEFNLTLTVNGKAYRVQGNFALDVYNTLSVNATVYDSNNLGIIDAKVIYANGTVFLTVNGINVAFAVDNEADIDIEELLSKLEGNEQLKEFLSNVQLDEFVAQIVGIVEKASSITLEDLLDTDFTTVVTRFGYVDNVLSLTVDGAAFGFDGLSVDLTLANHNGNLSVTVQGLTLATVSLDVEATLNTDVETIEIPQVEDYILNLHLQVLGAEVEISANFVEMNVWGSLKYGDEVLLMRYVDGKIYVQYGGANILLDTTDLSAIISKINQLVGDREQSEVTSSLDVFAILAAVVIDFTGDTPNISLDVKGVSAKINFVNDGGKLKFSNITVQFEVADKEYTAVLEKQSKQAEELPIDGEFVDANALIEQLLTSVETLLDGKVSVTAEFTVIVNGKTYLANVELNVNGGIYAKVLLREEGRAVVAAEIYVVDNVLYFDVNGIRQAIELPKSDGEFDFEQFDVEQIVGILSQLEGYNDALDGILQKVAELPTIFEGKVFSKIIQSLTFNDGILALELNLEQFNLETVTLTVGLGDQITASVNGFATDKFALDVNATVARSDRKVTAPDLNGYVTELKLTVGDLTAYVKLDLYNKKVLGVAEIYGATVNFKYFDGVIYATLGGNNNVAVKFALEDVEAVLDAIRLFVEIPDTSMGDVNVADTIRDVLDKIGFSRQMTEKGYAIEINYDGIAIAVNFVCSSDSVTLANVEVNVGGVAVKAEQVSGKTYVDLATNGKYVDVAELVTTFAEPVYEIVNAEGYAISVNGTLSANGKAYGLEATLTLIGGDVHVIFSLSHGGIYMFKDAELWVADNVLYLHAGDLKFAIRLDEDAQEDGELTVDSLKQKLTDVKGYNSAVDGVIDVVLSILDITIQDVEFDKLLTSLSFADKQLSLTVDGNQFDLSKFTLALGLIADGNNVATGLQLSLANFTCGGVTLNLSKATVFAYSGSVNAPVNEDFSTNLVIDVQDFDPESNVSGEHNVIYVSINLLEGEKGVILGRIETTLKDKSKSILDVKYTLDDNVLKITNGHDLNVMVDINGIADIVNRINDIVNEIAGAGDQALPDLFGSLGGEVDLKSIISSLSVDSVDGNVLAKLSAMGFNVTASFNNGLDNVTIPVDLIESNLVATLGKKITYSHFSDDSSKYVSIDQVFRDFYYGEDEEESNNNGPIYNLIKTNSWLFWFNADSEINVYDEETGTTTSYVIVQGSYVAFYYLKASKDLNRDADFKLRAHLTVQKDGGEFLYLDVMYNEGRIYATYDSRKWDKDSKGKLTENTNELKATVSMEAINDTINLLPALIEVVPQIGDLKKNLEDAMSNAESKMTLGNVSKILHSVSYEQQPDGDNVKNVFTLQINGQAIDSNKFVANKDIITLKVSNSGDNGLSLDELSLTYGNVSVNINNLVVTASDKNEATGEYEYVEKYVYSYDTANHMNFDSIRELLSSFIITANDHDAAGNRHFRVEGKVPANILKVVNVEFGIYLNVDIDNHNNVYLAFKLVRDGSSLAFDDKGGNSYLLLNSKDNSVQIVRDSLQEYQFCTDKNIPTELCDGNTLHKARYHINALNRKTWLDSTYNQYKKGVPTPSYDVTVTMQEFSEHMMDYILEMINFGTVMGYDIEKEIRTAIDNPESKVYGIEDVLTDYNYSAANMQYNVVAELSAISDMLGTLNVHIKHNSDYALTQLTGDIKMVKNIISAELNLALYTPLDNFDHELYIGIAEQYARTHNYLW